MDAMQRLSQAGVIDAVRQWHNQAGHLRDAAGAGVPGTFAQTGKLYCLGRRTLPIDKLIGGRTVMTKSPALPPDRVESGHSSRAG